MDKMTKKIVGAFAAIVLVAAAVLAGYFMLNKQAQQKAREQILPTTEVGKILAKDLDEKYPETPTEVLKMYWRINRCMYNNSLSDGDFDKLLKQIRKLYDDELLADKNNSFNTMKKNFKKDIEKRSDEKQNFSSYVVQKNDTLTIKELQGKECTTVITSTLIKAKSNTSRTFESFMCRKDDSGRWKILGWEQTNADTASSVGIE